MHSRAPTAPARWDSILFGCPDPDVMGRACPLWTIPVLVLALLLGAACSDSTGTGADAAADRPADTADCLDRQAPRRHRARRSRRRRGIGAQADTGGADTGGGDVAPDAAPARLCDGTLQPRLIYLNTGGGPLPSTAAFTEANGIAFFVIDGTCHYWAGESYLKGIHTGVLATGQGRPDCPRPSPRRLRPPEGNHRSGGARRQHPHPQRWHQRHCLHRRLHPPDAHAADARRIPAGLPAAGRRLPRPLRQWHRRRAAHPGDRP